MAGFSRMIGRRNAGLSAREVVGRTVTGSTALKLHAARGLLGASFASPLAAATTAKAQAAHSEIAAAESGALFSIVSNEGAWRSGTMFQLESLVGGQSRAVSQARAAQNLNAFARKGNELRTSALAAHDLTPAARGRRLLDAASYFLAADEGATAESTLNTAIGDFQSEIAATQQRRLPTVAIDAYLQLDSELPAYLDAVDAYGHLGDLYFDQYVSSSQTNTAVFDNAVAAYRAGLRTFGAAFARIKETPTFWNRYPIAQTDYKHLHTINARLPEKLNLFGQGAQVEEFRTEWKPVFRALDPVDVSLVHRRIPV